MLLPRKSRRRRFNDKRDLGCKILLKDQDKKGSEAMGCQVRYSNVPKDYGIKQSGSTISSDTIYSVSFWLRGSPLLGSFLFVLFLLKAFYLVMNTKKLSRLMYLSWEVQRKKKFNRSRSLQSAWAIILTKDITVFNLVKKHSHDRYPNKVHSHDLTLFHS